MINNTIKKLWNTSDDNSILFRNKLNLLAYETNESQKFNICGIELHHQKQITSDFFLEVLRDFIDPFIFSRSFLPGITGGNVSWYRDAITAPQKYLWRNAWSGGCFSYSGIQLIREIDDLGAEGRNNKNNKNGSRWGTMELSPREAVQPSNEGAKSRRAGLSFFIAIPSADFRWLSLAQCGQNEKWPLIGRGTLRNFSFEWFYKLQAPDRTSSNDA